MRKNKTDKSLEKVNNVKLFNRLSAQMESELDKLRVEAGDLSKEINAIEETINQKNSDNVIIEKALTNVDNPLDCTVYENKLTELRTFNYATYCNNLVYGGINLNDGTKQSQYNDCIKTKTLQNQKDEVIYSQLLEDCRSKNRIETELKNAKFENNTELVNELETQLYEVNQDINRLTTDYNNTVSFDESVQTSQLENNDTQNTINRTAELLNVTTKSITDDSGNLTLTDSQKITLNIIYTKNKSQISKLFTTQEEKNALFTENQFKQNKIITDTKGEQNLLKIGNTIANWVIGILGLYSMLKGYLDPETAGVVMAALNVGGIKDDNPPPPPLTFGCARSLGTYDYDYANGFKYLITSPTNPSLTTDPSLSMDPSYTTSNWQLVSNNLYQRGPCFGTRSEIDDPNSENGLGGDTDDLSVGNFERLPSGPGGLGLPPVPEQPPCWPPPCIPVDVGDSTDDKRCEFNNPSLFTQSPTGALLYNGKDIPSECCNSNTLPLIGQYNFVNGECLFTSNTVGGGDPEVIDTCCDLVSLQLLQDSLEELQQEIPIIEQKTQECYDNWYNTLVEDYEVYEEENNSYFDSYLDDLKVNFKLFVNNTNVDTQTNIDTGLTYLPYTQSVNPIWEWDPTNGYTGVILEGTEQEIAVIEDGIFNHLSQLNVPYNGEMFEPAWQTFKFTIPECVCDDLRRLYPNKEFFFSIELENYECSLCLLVDNIQVNVSDCQTNRILSINDCMVPQLSCVIDNKKSWVYYDDGVVKQTIYPNGDCNTGSTSNYEIVKLGAQQERLWLDLEYRYTDYDINHSDLILNVKNATFSIDPAKAIECDVFNYWKNIDCDNCPTKCLEDSKTFEDQDDFLFQDCNTYLFEDQSTEHSVVFSGEVLSSGYTLSFNDIVTTGLTFSCSTYTDSLTQSVLSLKNKFYALTSDYIESLDATYYQLLEKGESLDNFYIQENNCGTDTIVINDNSSLNNLFGIITENYDGTISLFETYLYTGSTPYSGGVLSEVLSGTGVTAQTFNQKLSIDQECCESLNDLLNGEGATGLGLGKNYQWDSSNCFCTWKPLDDCDKCKGDCEYCGQKKECVDGFATGDTYSVCINPLDYLDIQPSEINIKAVFDQLVQTNLIDVKSRQTITDYPLLRLFYELYLNASNCGKDLSGKYTYDTMFEFMDKIGDYWLDLLEQVVPATTIWEGCDNSGKIYRNTIFDNNKFNYKRYSLNFIDVEVDCPLSAQTDFSIGSETKHSLVEQKPIYPSSPEITKLKTNILNKELEIALLKKQISVEQSKLCAIRLQDLDTPNLQDLIDAQQSQIDLLNSELDNLNQELIDLNTQLDELENEYLQQQQNYYMNFMSCSGITQNLINAQNNLSGFTQGTTAYETQRNFIAGLRDKYTKCVRKANTLVSDYNTVFITQIYDSNEYEGNVEIFGDPDFDPPEFTKTLPPTQISGFYYNQELIHNCEN